MQCFENIKSSEQLGELVPKIVECIKSAFDYQMPVEEIVPEIKGDHVFLTMDTEDNVSGFSALVFGSPNELIENCIVSAEKGCYFSAATVAKNAQRLGIYKQLNRKRLEVVMSSKSRLVFTETQNPRVEEGIISVLKTLVEEGKIKRFVVSRIKMEQAYGRMLTAQIPIGKYTVYDKLDYKNGDAYILLFHLEY